MNFVLNGKTYSSVGFDANGVSVFQESSSGIPGGFSYLSCRVTIAKSGDAPSKVVWRLTMPILASEDSACGCSGNVLRLYRYDDGKITIPAGSLAAERTDFEARLQDLYADAAYTASIVNLVQPN